MTQPEFKIRATFQDGKDLISAEAEYLSKYSVYIRFLNGKAFPNGFVFPKATFKLNGHVVKLGPCKLLKTRSRSGAHGKIVFVKDIYDLDDLFFKKNLVKLQASFHSLPMILGRKDKIDHKFRKYTSDLTYDLSAYKEAFDQIDDQIAGETTDVRNSIRRSIIETEGRKFMGYLDEQLVDLQKIVGDYSDEDHERHGFFFRKQLWHIIRSSPIILRTNIKPRGYAGDFEMMRMIYDNNYEGDSTFGMILHKHPMEHPAAQAVRTRRQLISRSFHDFSAAIRSNGQQNLSVLSVACGPAYELRDILHAPQNGHRLNFTLLDQDHLALDAAKGLVKSLKAGQKNGLSVNYLNESVRTMLTTNRIAEKWGKFHFIYSMGLFDYLTPPAARVVIKKLFQLLAPDGEMIIGNFHPSNPSRLYMEYWLDWVLFYRTEEEFMNLLATEPTAKSSVFFENTGSQMFLHVRKTG